MSLVSTVNGKEYINNSRGDLVPLDKVRPVDMLRDDVVGSIIDKGAELSNAIKDFKKFAMAEAESFVKVSFDEYGVKWGGDKGNVSLLSYDGKYKVSINVQDVLEFDERLQAAKEIIDKCIHKWAEGSNDNLRVIVNNAFRVDKKGNVDTKRILELRRYDIEDEDWAKAMDAISESITVSYSKRYMRIYRKDNEGKFIQIPLDFSAV